MASFISERNMKDETLPLGFTFSFPCAQEGLTKARLTQWTKGFKCSGVEGQDVVALLQDAIARRGVSNSYFISLLLLGGRGPVAMCASTCLLFAQQSPCHMFTTCLNFGNKEIFKY